MDHKGKTGEATRVVRVAGRGTKGTFKVTAPGWRATVHIGQHRVNWNDKHHTLGCRAGNTFAVVLPDDPEYWAMLYCYRLRGRNLHGDLVAIEGGGSDVLTRVR